MLYPIELRALNNLDVIPIVAELMAVFREDGRLACSRLALPADHPEAIPGRSSWRQEQPVF
jgi:hypothetical protein